MNAKLRQVVRHNVTDGEFALDSINKNVVNEYSRTVVNDWKKGVTSHSQYEIMRVVIVFTLEEINAVALMH